MATLFCKTKEGINMNTGNYIHLRYIDRISVFDSGFLRSRGGVTIFWKYEESVLYTGRIILSFGIAICSKKDNFDKKLGRDIAFSRANENRLTISRNVFKGMDKLEQYYYLKNLVISTVEKQLDIDVGEGSEGGPYVIYQTFNS